MYRSQQLCCHHPTQADPDQTSRLNKSLPYHLRCATIFIPTIITTWVEEQMQMQNLMGALCSWCDLSAAMLLALFCLTGGPSPPALGSHCWSDRAWELLRRRSACCCSMNCCRMSCCCFRRSWEARGGRPGLGVRLSSDTPKEKSVDRLLRRARSGAA